MSLDAPVVEVVREAPIRHVRFDDGRRNALSVAAVDALREAFEPDPDAPVVVLRGRTEAFCVGLDNAVLAAGDAERSALLAGMGELLHMILSGPTRLVVGCEGHAVAAGAMLLLVADVRIGVPGEYQIGFTEPRLGMPLPRLPAELARQRLDRRWLHETAVLGRTLGPDAAAEAGFLDAVVSPGELDASLAERALEVARLGERAYLGSLHAVWGDVLERVEAEAAGARERAESARSAR